MSFAKRCIPVLLLSLAATTAQAQTTTGTIAVNAAVQSAVTVTKVADLALGTLIPGAGAVITPANGGQVKAHYNVATKLTTGDAVTLSETNGGTISVALACAQASTTGATSPTAITACSTGYTTTVGATGAADSYMYIGGTIAATATTNAPAGSYTGSLTVTATYTTF